MVVVVVVKSKRPKWTTVGIHPFDLAFLVYLSLLAIICPLLPGG